MVVSKEIMEKLAFTKTPQPIMARCFIQKDKKLVDGNIVAVKYKNQLAMAFHPELGGNSGIHRMFAEMMCAR